MKTIACGTDGKRQVGRPPARSGRRRVGRMKAAKGKIPRALPRAGKTSAAGSRDANGCAWDTARSRVKDGSIDRVMNGAASRRPARPFISEGDAGPPGKNRRGAAHGREARRVSAEAEWPGTMATPAARRGRDTLKGIENSGEALMRSCSKLLRRREGRDASADGFGQTHRPAAVHRTLKRTSRSAGVAGTNHGRKGNRFDQRSLSGRPAGKPIALRAGRVYADESRPTARACRGRRG